MGFVFLTANGESAVWTVSVGGGGDYSQISEAILSPAVVSGDELRILPGTYGGFVVNKAGLTIRGSHPAQCRVVGVVDGAAIQASTRIVGLGFTGGRRGIWVESQGIIVEIRNCLVVGSAEHGIYVNGAAALTPVLIENCVMAYNGSDGAVVWGGSGMRTTLRNCVFFRNAAWGVYGAPTVDRSCFFDNKSGQAHSPSNTTNSFTLDPRFVDPSIGDYRLQRSPISPCIDAGSPGASFLDPDGTQNDIGAFGGPESLGFFPDAGGGPRVSELVVEPAVVNQGGTVTIRASVTAE